jgi:hypothetical protein
MKKLFYRLASSRSLAKIFSMDAQLEEGTKRVIFPKRLFFAVLGLAAFVSSGALLFPQVVQAQDCLFDCPDLGSGPSLDPWINSPQALDIAYCFDRDCVLNLKDGKGNLIFTGNSIPTPSVSHQPAFSCPGPGNVTISGTVVALLKDKKGNLVPNSAAQAELTIIIKGVSCSSDSTRLSRVVGVNEPRTDVFDPASSIIILPPTTPGTPASLISKGKGWTGCPTNNTGTLSGRCLFPLGIEEFTAGQRANQLPATTTGPQVNRFQVGEVFLAVKSTKFVGVRDCKGDPQDAGVPPAPLPAPDPSTINCSVGEILTGGDAQGLLTFKGNWSGATAHTINPKSGTNPFDILTPLFGSILPNTVTASANDGPEVPTTGCNDIVNQQTERCFFSARALLPNGCTSGVPVDILVRGKLDIQDGNGNDFRFVSKDNPTCQ